MVIYNENLLELLMPSKGHAIFPRSVKQISVVHPSVCTELMKKKGNKSLDF